MRTAQRAVRHSRVRRSSVRARRRIYVGTTVTRRSSSPIFLSPRTQQMASRTRLADWVGGAADVPPRKLDSAIIFAPAGELVIAALKALDKGGTLALAGIHMSQIPPIDYDLLYQERIVRSVANNTRKDGEDFLRLAAEIPIHTEVEEYRLEDANAALNALKHDSIRGAAVLKV